MTTQVFRLRLDVLRPRLPHYKRKKKSCRYQSPNAPFGAWLLRRSLCAYLSACLVLQTSLNALNVNLLTMPEEQQQMAAEAAAAASELTQPALVAGTMSKGSSTADKSIVRARQTTTFFAPLCMRISRTFCITVEPLTLVDDKCPLTGCNESYEQAQIWEEKAT